MERNPRIPTEQLRTEEDRIRSFAMALFEPAKGRKVPVEEVFERYQAWLQDRGMPATPLSVGGFGRLFPRQFVRRSIWTPDGTKRGFLDVQFRVQ